MGGSGRGWSRVPLRERNSNVALGASLQNCARAPFNGVETRRCHAASMLNLFSRRTDPTEVETELAIAQRKHDLECAILYGALLIGGPLLELPRPMPTQLRKRKMKRFRAHRWPRVDLD